MSPSLASASTISSDPPRVSPLARDLGRLQQCSHEEPSSYPEFGQLRLAPDERAWLEKTCPYFKPEYLDYLEAYRFNPEQLRLEFEPVPEDEEKNARDDPSARGNIHIDALGPWEETILWEVPLMACLSEIYFTTTDRDWDYEGQFGACMKWDRTTRAM